MEYLWQLLETLNSITDQLLGQIIMDAERGVAAEEATDRDSLFASVSSLTQRFYFGGLICEHHPLDLSTLVREDVLIVLLPDKHHEIRKSVQWD